MSDRPAELRYHIYPVYEERARRVPTAFQLVALCGFVWTTLRDRRDFEYDPSPFTVADYTNTSIATKYFCPKCTSHPSVQLAKLANINL